MFITYQFENCHEGWDKAIGKWTTACFMNPVQIAKSQAGTGDKQVRRNSVSLRVD